MVNLQLQHLSTIADKSELRRKMQQRRREISISAQKQASRDLCRILCNDPAFLGADRIAGYVAVNGEIDPQPLLQRALHLGKHIYLPALIADRMAFVPHNPDAASLSRNRFGIPEPHYDKALELAPSAINLMLVPLLAFDSEGRRLGMGGGFYDRALSFKRDRSAIAKPLLLGLAHACQQVARVPVDNWDVALAAVATDRTLLKFDQAG